MSNNNKTLKIKCNPKDPKEKFLNIKLEQDFEKLEMLSLTLKQDQIYRSFSADYGVVVGRVQTNQVGIPNCKISVFIPISDADKLIPEILSIYPYSSPTDVNPNNGKIYNLLNKLKRLNPFSGFKENNYQLGYNKVAVGSIPDKVELLTNPTSLEVYHDYYKFTTITNSFGDFMIFGVPVGSQTLHLDCDITDIGILSSSIPILTQVDGLDPTLFNDDGTQIKETNDLTSIPILQRQNIPVNVVPFWGPVTETIGITRQDFNITAKITPHFTLVGAGFTQGSDSWWGDNIIFRAVVGFKNLCIKLGDCDQFDSLKTKTSGLFLRLCFGYNIRAFKKTIAKGTINIGGDGSPCINDSSTFSIHLCIFMIIENIIPFICVKAFSFNKCDMNGGEFNEPSISIKNLGATSTCGGCTEIQTSAVSNFDDFTENLNLDDCRIGEITEQIFYYKSTVSANDIATGNIDINNDIILLRSNEYAKIKSPDGTFLYQIPCNYNRVITDEFGNQIPTDDPTQGLYSQFYGYIIFSMVGLDIGSSGSKIITGRARIKVPACTDYNEDSWVKNSYLFNEGNVYSVAQYMSVANDDNQFMSHRTGILLDVNTSGQTDTDLYGIDMEMKENGSVLIFSTKFSNTFKQAWLNGCLFFLQGGYKKKRGKKKDKACDIIFGTEPRTRDNSEPLGANIVNNRFILNNSSYQTNFIELNKDDLVDVIVPMARRGFSETDSTQNLMNTTDNGLKYFYKGLNDNNNSIKNLIGKNIV